MPATPPDDADDDDLFELIGDITAAQQVAADPTVDPELRNMASQAAERGAAELKKYKPGA